MDHDSQHLHQKKQLYRSLDSLDDSDEDTDPGRKASEAAWHKASKPQPPKTLTSPPQENRLLARSASDSDLGARHRSLSRVEPAIPPASTDPRNALLSRRALLPSLRKSVSDTTATTKIIGKRKRGASVVTKSGKRGIFQGLHFFFFPNNAVHPARRMRIEKSVEHGAAWEQKWTDDVTHAILDEDLDLSVLTKYLGVEQMPGEVPVVRDAWRAESLTRGMLMDPHEQRFAVKGVQRPQLPQEPSNESNKSLQVEAVSKSAAHRRAQTPPTEQRNPTATEVDSGKLNTPRDANPVTEENINSAVETSEEFDEAIKQARLLQDVPLDDDELNNGPPHSFEGESIVDSSDEQQTTDLKLLPKRRKKKYKDPLDKFQCMQKHTGDGSKSPNLPTINILQQMADYYGQIGDEWRIRAYRKAMATLRNHPTKVQTRKQALTLPNIGDRLATKIEEIASTNRLKRLESARAEPGDQILQTFMKVYGAGIVQASRWVDEGHRSLDDLLLKASLTDNQKIGIEHYADFNSRIPRAEVERHGTIVRQKLHEIDPNFEVIVGGSYRRGSKDSGDIDLIITRPDTNADHLRSVVLGQLVPRLTSEGFLVASLAITSRDDGSKWHGASRLPDSSIWRRLDLLLVPSDELGAALIYFTGNDIFNRSLRLLASTKGMRLNQRGLYAGVLRGPGRAKLTEGTLVEGKDEKRIFEVLGVPWRPPEHRIC